VREREVTDFPSEKYKSQKKYEKRMYLKKSEAIHDRIMENFSISNGLKDEFIQKWYAVSQKIPPRIKYRNPYCSCPIFCFLFYKSRGISLNKTKIKELYNITEKNFRKGLRVILPLYNEFQNRDKKGITIKHLVKVTEKLNLNAEITITAIYLLDGFWSRLNRLKEEVIAGIIFLLTYIKLEISSPKFSTVCKMVPVNTSSVYYSMNKYIFKNFRGIKTSSPLVKTFLEMYGPIKVS